MILILFREIFVFVIYFGIFELFCYKLIFERGSIDCIGFLVILVVGGLSGIFLWVVIYLIDVVKLRL